MTAADELEVRYARVAGGTHAAYAVVGAGARDIVWLGDGIATFEDLVEQSISMRWSEVLRRFGRLILIDLPGIERHGVLRRHELRRRVEVPPCGVNRLCAEPSI